MNSGKQSIRKRGEARPAEFSSSTFLSSKNLSGATRRETIGGARVFPTFAGRSIGTAIIVSFQLLIGAIHVFFGLWLLSVSTVDCVYSAYTVVFGLMSLVFAVGLWMGKSWGWFGTFVTLLFVAVADALTLLNLPSIPGIPKFAAVPEIGYSVVVVLYLVQPHVRVNLLRLKQ